MTDVQLFLQFMICYPAVLNVNWFALFNKTELYGQVIMVYMNNHKWLPEFLQKLGSIKVMQMRLKKPKCVTVMSKLCRICPTIFFFFPTQIILCVFTEIWVNIHCCVWADLYATSEVLLLKVDSVRITGFCWYYWCRVFYCMLFFSWPYANVCFSFMCLHSYLMVLIIIWA